MMELDGTSYLTSGVTNRTEIPEEVALMKQPTDQALPKARANGLLVRELEDELLVYDLNRHKAHCLNTTAAKIWNQCDGEKTVTQIAASLSNESGTQVDESVVWLGLKSLERNYLLTEQITRTLGAKAVTRRDVLRRLGVGAAVALPLVTSVFAPRATEAATCKTVGQLCAANAECCSGTCTGCPTGCTVCT